MDRLSHANWNLIPEHMRGGVRRWIEHGIFPGSFLTAVIENDLRTAVAKADDINVNRLADYVRFFHCDAPAGCWGSPEKVEAWNARGGLIGNETEAA